MTIYFLTSRNSFGRLSFQETKNRKTKVKSIPGEKGAMSFLSALNVVSFKAGSDFSGTVRGYKKEEQYSCPN